MVCFHTLTNTDASSPQAAPRIIAGGDLVNRHVMAPDALCSRCTDQGPIRSTTHVKNCRSFSSRPMYLNLGGLLDAPSAVTVQGRSGWSDMQMVIQYCESASLAFQNVALRSPLFLRLQVSALLTHRSHQMTPSQKRALIPMRLSRKTILSSR